MTECQRVELFGVPVDALTLNEAEAAFEPG